MRAAAVALASIVAVSVGGSQAADAETIYQRAQIENAVSGAVTVSARYEVVLDLPGGDCVEGRFQCLRPQRYGQLYRIEFALDELSHREGGPPELASSPAGTIYIATDLDGNGELELEAAVEAAIVDLHGASFRHPFAGWSVGLSPLTQNLLLGPSNRTAWLCIDHEPTAYSFHVTPQLDEDRVIGVVTGRNADEPGDAVCGALRRGVDAEGGYTVSTPYDVGSLVRTEIEVEVDWFPGAGGVASFQPLPEDMEYTKVEVDRELSGSSMGLDAETGYTMSRTGNGVKQEMKLGRFTLDSPTPDTAAWVTRWTVSTWSQTFGAEAGEEILSREELWVVALPVFDPVADAGARPRDPGSERIAAVLGAFDRASRLDVNLVAEAFHSTVGDGLDVGDWMLVYCSPSREPEYGMARFFARSPMRNGADVCDAIDRLYR